MHLPAKRNVSTTELILNAATREFAHFGFKKVTMHEIAREVDMGKASLYYYFRTKESLYRAVILREHALFMRSVVARLASTSTGSEKIITYIEQRSAYFNRMLNLNILDVRSSTRMKPLIADMFDSFSKQELKILRSIIREGRKKGEFTVRSEEKVARALLYTLQGLRLRFLRMLDVARFDQRHVVRLEQEQRFVTEIFLRGIQK